jgi:hypothetical protein
MKKTAALLAALTAMAGAEESQTFLQKALNPDISLIVDVAYVDRNVDDHEVSHLEVPGVAHSIIGSHSHGEHSHATYNASNGFNLNYGELSLSSEVDPNFTLDGVFHFSEESVEIEEAYFTTTALPYGFRLKGGKFFSDFGRHNNSHHHVWDFADAPLVYDAFLGSHGLNEKGMQLQWVAPTDTYLMVGAELLQGENEQMFGIGEIEYDVNETTTVEVAEAADAPALVVAYAKSSFDIGDTSLLAGVSYATGDSRVDHLEDEEPHAFYGDSELYGADLTLKHYYSSYRSLSWETEWLYRDMDGHKYLPTGATPAVHKKQAGYYSQLVYAHDQNWRAGLRYGNIYQNDVTANGVDQSMPENLDRYSVMAEYNPSEFSRIRLQYNVNQALYDDEEGQKDVKTLILQFNYAIGAHGAHAF